MQAFPPSAHLAVCLLAWFICFRQTGSAPTVTDLCVCSVCPFALIFARYLFLFSVQFSSLSFSIFVSFSFHILLLFLFFTFLFPLLLLPLFYFMILCFPVSSGGPPRLLTVAFPSFFFFFCPVQSLTCAIIFLSPWRPAQFRFCSFLLLFAFLALPPTATPTCKNQDCVRASWVVDHFIALCASAILGGVFGLFFVPLLSTPSHNPLTACSMK